MNFFFKKAKEENEDDPDFERDKEEYVKWTKRDYEEVVEHAIEGLGNIPLYGETLKTLRYMLKNDDNYDIKGRIMYYFTHNPTVKLEKVPELEDTIYHYIKNGTEDQKYDMVCNLGELVGGRKVVEINGESIIKILENRKNENPENTNEIDAINAVIKKVKQVKEELKEMRRRRVGD